MIFRLGRRWGVSLAHRHTEREAGERALTAKCGVVVGGVRRLRVRVFGSGGLS
jgi:hypothetical protein